MKAKYIIFLLIALAGHACWGASREEMENGDGKAVKQLTMVALTEGALESLPDEMIVSIAEFLDQQSLIRLAQVNQRVSRIVKKAVVIHLLSEHNGNLQAALINAVEHNLPWEISCLLPQEGVDVNALDVNGRTVLMAAAVHGWNNVVAQLIQAGALVGVTSANDELSALKWAAMLGFDNVVTQLVQAKADVNATGAKAWTALMLAAAQGWAQVIQMLLDGRADRRITNDNDETALDIALRLNKTDIVELLLNYWPIGG